MRIEGPGEIGDPRRQDKIKPKSPSEVLSERAADGVEISSTGRYLSDLAKVPDVRQDKIEAIRQEMAKGTYITPERLEAALDSLIDDLA